MNTDDWSFEAELMGELLEKDMQAWIKDKNPIHFQSITQKIEWIGMIQAAHNSIRAIMKGAE